MFLELYNNRKQIIKNYSKILYNNRKWIFIILGSIFLLLIYALISIKEYKLSIEKQYYHNILENKKLKNLNLLNNLNLEGYENFNKNNNNKNNNNKNNNNKNNNNKNNNNTLSRTNNNIKKIVNNSNLIQSLQFITDKHDNLYKSLISYISVEYLVHMDYVNIISRGFNNMIDISKKYEQELISKITDAEKDYLNESVNAKLLELNDISSNDKNKQSWVLNILENCKISKGQKWLEMGMPHTHSDVIIFNKSIFTNFNWNTFIHECVHIDQRKNMNKYRELYMIWGFIHTNISTIKGMENIMTRNRLNPDAIDCNWLWKCPSDNNYYWIGAVFNSITPTSLGDVSYVGLKIESDSMGNYYYNGTDSRNLNSWYEFQNYFNIKNNQYHPNEIIAEYMSIYFDENNYDKIGFNKTMKNIKGYNIFTKWFSRL